MCFQAIERFQLLLRLKACFYKRADTGLPRGKMLKVKQNRNDILSQFVLALRGQVAGCL